MKLIELGEDREKAVARFSILHAMAFQGRGPQSVAESRRLSKVQDKLEEVSDGELLREGVTSVALDDAEVELLKLRAFGAEIPWLAAANRRLTDAFDVLDKAVEWKPEAEKKPMLELSEDDAA